MQRTGSVLCEVVIELDQGMVPAARQYLNGA